MSVLALTGATGFVGGALLDLLRAAGHEARALTRRPLPARDGVHWVAGALADADALAELVTGADAVIHVAGVVNAPDRAGFERGNVAGTAAMLLAARARGVDRFVHVSSLAAREPGLSLYGASKAAAEAAVTASGLDWTIVRPPGVYGPGDTELLDMFRAARRGIVPLPPGGRASWIYVDDLARLLLALTEAPSTSGQLYEADDGVANGWAHADFARAIGHAVGREVRPVAMPKPVLRIAARLDRLTRGAKAKLTPDRVDYIAHLDWTIDAAKRPPAALWTPEIDTRAGLAATAASYRATGLLGQPK